ncbi:MAG: hypothetical protein ACRDZP_01155, partial [Acidimicrobiales bacterium]
DVPEASMTEEKVVRVAERLGVRLFTCSPDVARLQQLIGLPIIDLRDLCADLLPDPIPGEHLSVDLLRPGRQARQAIGYLSDGDMVVVNDAEHLVGHAGVDVVVLSTRPTAQGVIVFAQLAPDKNDEALEGALREA